MSAPFLAADESSRPATARAPRFPERVWLRRWLFRLSVGYALGLVVWLLLLEWAGERNWLLSLAVFAPPQLFLAPLAVLAPLALLVYRKLLLWHGACVLGLAFGFMTFRWSPLPTAQAGMLTVVTHNVGQGNADQFAGFLTAQAPDAVLLQDAQHRLSRYRTRFPEYETAVCGEFILLSRHLIQQSLLVAAPRHHGRAVAARFEIVFEGRRVALYSVHLPTPRGQFNRFLSRRLVNDLLDEDGVHSTPASYESWLDERAQLIADLAKVLENEPLPCIVGGDFNMPDHGYLYHLLTTRMTDAFARCGRGWGLTFPGETRNPVAFFGPWLRIDYLFAGPGWNPLSCAAEPGRKSQHRAVVARFQPQFSR